MLKKSSTSITDSTPSTEHGPEADAIFALLPSMVAKLLTFPSTIWSNRLFLITVPATVENLPNSGIAKVSTLFALNPCLHPIWMSASERMNLTVLRSNLVPPMESVASCSALNVLKCERLTLPEMTQFWNRFLPAHFHSQIVDRITSPLWRSAPPMLNMLMAWTLMRFALTLIDDWKLKRRVGITQSRSSSFSLRAESCCRVVIPQSHVRCWLLRSSKQAVFARSRRPTLHWPDLLAHMSRQSGSWFCDAAMERTVVRAIRRQLERRDMLAERGVLEEVLDRVFVFRDKLGSDLFENE